MSGPYVRPLDLRRGRIDMSHGSGGRAMTQLVEELFARELDNPFLAQGDDGARLPEIGGRMVMATDAHVVSPLFFPGGDIGSLAVHGTINDVAVMGATPLYLAASFILEEGFPLADLSRIVASMAAASRAAGVPVVTGDTKVVERGKADGVLITTTGVGVLRPGVECSGSLACPGDAVLVSGSVGEHGMAIMSVRDGLSFDAPILSDSASLHGLIGQLLAAVPEVRVLRDATRGGVATTLNEIARQSEVGMLIMEEAIPVQPAVEAACELLGLDPLYVANEGKFIAICPGERSAAALAALGSHTLGRRAARSGTVHADPRHFIQMQTRLGGRRIVDWLTGDQLPRIC